MAIHYGVLLLAARQEMVEFYEEFYCYRRPDPTVADEPQAGDENDPRIANLILSPNSTLRN